MIGGQTGRHADEDSSRKNSMLFLRWLTAPPAVRRSSSTERISGLSCSFWLRSCACSLSSNSRSMRSTGRWNRLTVDQSRSSRSGSSRVSLRVETRASRVAHQPVAALAPAVGEIVAAHRLGLPRANALYWIALPHLGEGVDAARGSWHEQRSFQEMIS